jgi:chromosomal replication initiation ATPase DnaA
MSVKFCQTTEHRIPEDIIFHLLSHFPSLYDFSHWKFRFFLHTVKKWKDATKQVITSNVVVAQFLNDLSCHKARPLYELGYVITCVGKYYTNTHQEHNIKIQTRNIYTSNQHVKSENTCICEVRMRVP